MTPAVQFARLGGTRPFPEHGSGGRLRDYRRSRRSLALTARVKGRHLRRSLGKAVGRREFVVEVAVAHRTARARGCSSVVCMHA